MASPIRVAVTGAAGNIGYSLLWRIASGDCFGPDQPVILQLLEIPQGMGRLEGVVMELDDSAFPLVHGIETSDDAKVAFNGASAVFLVGSRPRSAGMQRADLVAANGPIFVGQGKALNEVAADDVRVITVGNPCNTNCLIAAHNAPDIPKSRFSAMTRLDQNRATGLAARRLGVAPASVDGIVVWGNHANTMWPDVSEATVNGEPLTSKLDAGFLGGEFIDIVSDRGKAIIDARGASSAASAASAAIDHMHDWWRGTHNRAVSMAVVSDGWYDVPAGLVFSFPCTTAGKEYTVQTGRSISPFGRQKLQANIDALLEERAAVADLLR